MKRPVYTTCFLVLETYFLPALYIATSDSVKGSDPYFLQDVPTCSKVPPASSSV